MRIAMYGIEEEEKKPGGKPGTGNRGVEREREREKREGGRKIGAVRYSSTRSTQACPRRRW